jgi:peptide methionine sulfoxide reductase MsrA
MKTTVGIAALATRVNAWEAFWMAAKRHRHWVDANAECKHERQRTKITMQQNVLGECFLFYQPCTPS